MWEGLVSVCENRSGQICFWSPKSLDFGLPFCYESFNTFTFTFLISLFTFCCVLAVITSPDKVGHGVFWIHHQIAEPWSGRNLPSPPQDSLCPVVVDRHPLSRHLALSFSSSSPRHVGFFVLIFGIDMLVLCFDFWCKEKAFFLFLLLWFLCSAVPCRLWAAACSFGRRPSAADKPRCFLVLLHGFSFQSLSINCQLFSLGYQLA